MPIFNKLLFTGNRSSHAIRLLAILLFSGYSALANAISFQQVTGTAAPFRSAEAWGAAWGDYNNDRCPDLFVNHHRQRAAMYKNNCNGTFKDATSKVDIERNWLDHNWITDHHGAVWGDFDNDGDQDLYAITGARFDGELMVNEGRVLVNRSAEHNVLQDREGWMPMWVDYDNDRALDLFMQTRTIVWPYHQNPNGTFSDSRNPTGFKITNPPNAATNYGHLIDLDNDGNLDYLGMPEGLFPTGAYDISQFPFRDIKDNIPSIGPVCDSATADFNGDQRNDLLLVRGRVRPVQAKQFGTKIVEGWLTSGANAPDKSFRFKAPNGNLDIELHSHMGLVRFHIGSNGYHPGESARVNATHYRLSLNASESRNQGIKPHDPSASSARGVYMGYIPSSQEWVIQIASGGQNTTAYLIITSSANVSNVVTTGLSGSDKAISPIMLLNNGQGFAGTTQPLTQSSNIGALGTKVSCISAGPGDFDNDMDIDVYLVCRGGVENIANRLYSNRGNGQFDLVSNAGGAQGPVGAQVSARKGNADSVVVADFNGDGKLDMYVTNGQQLFPVRFNSDDQLYKNTTSGNNRWIELDLVGTASNRDAIGAKVYATAGGKTQLREQNGGQHRWSQHHQRIHFGLKGNQTVNLRIEWPSGLVNTHNNVASNKLYTVTEGGAITHTPMGPVAPDGASGGGGGSANFVINSRTVNENVGGAALTVTLSRSSTQTTKVDYATHSVSAQAGSDYQSKSGTLTFNPGQTSKTVSVTIVNDTTEEPTETFTVRLTNPVNAGISSSDGTVTIQDDDDSGGGGGGDGLSIQDINVDENVGNAQITVQLSPARTQTVTVKYATKPGSALPGEDFRGRSGTLTFNPGQTSQTIVVPIINDSTEENTETFPVKLSAASNAPIADGSATVTINDDDGSGGGGGDGLSIQDINVDENVGNAQITVQLSPARTQTVTVKYATKPGSALPGEDFRGRSGTLTFNPGQTSQTIVVPIINDSTEENTETFPVKLSAASNAPIADGSATVTINDDDGSGGGGGDGLSIQDINVDENVGNAQITVQLSPARTQTVTVKYATKPGSALPGEDFRGRSGTLTFNPGQTSQTIVVPIINDSTEENTETFPVKLSAASNAPIADGSATVTIQDND